MDGGSRPAGDRRRPHARPIHRPGGRAPSRQRSPGLRRPAAHLRAAACRGTGLREGLLALGVTKGSKVAVMLANRPEFVVAAYGATLIGAVAVPVSTLAAADERDYILGHCDASVLVTQASLVDRRFVDELIADHPDIGDAEPDGSRSPASRTCVASCVRSGHRSVEGWEDMVVAGTRVDDAVLDAAAASVVPSDDARSSTRPAPPLIQGGAAPPAGPGGAELALAGAARARSVRSGLEPVPVLLDRRAGVRAGRDAGVRCVLRARRRSMPARRSSSSSGSGSPPSTHSPTRPPPWWSTRGRPQAGPVVATAGGAGQRPAAVGPDRGGSRRPAGRRWLTETFTICTRSRRTRRSSCGRPRTA